MMLSPVTLMVVLWLGPAGGGRREFVADGPLQHLAVDRASRTLYAGATNHLYRLDAADLRPREPAVVVGPVRDHPQCTEQFGDERCSAGGSLTFHATTTDNVNKVLAVDSEHRQLVTCGSVFQGVCETRDLSNISVVTSPQYARRTTDYFVAANSPSASTVAFVGAGPSTRRAGPSAVLYVGSTYTGTTSTSVRQTVPAVSSRSLERGPGLLRFTHVDGLTGGTLLRLRSEAIEKLPIDYVAGFSAAGFAHFLTVQPRHFALEDFGAPPTVSRSFGSRVASVCERDRGFFSYVEMPLRCSTPTVAN